MVYKRMQVYLEITTNPKTCSMEYFLLCQEKYIYIKFYSYNNQTFLNFSNAFKSTNQINVSHCLAEELCYQILTKLPNEFDIKHAKVFNILVFRLKYIFILF